MKTTFDVKQTSDDLLRKNFGKLSRKRKAEEFIYDDLIAIPLQLPFFFGRYIQHHPMEYPRFLRWHLTNVVDVPCLAIAINAGFIVSSGRGRPIASTAITLAMGFAYKTGEAQGSGRGFDFVDMACFFAGAAVYLLTRKQIQRKVHIPRVLALDLARMLPR